MRHDARKLDRPSHSEDGPPLTPQISPETFQRQAAVLARDKNYAGVRAIYHNAFREHARIAAAFKKMAKTTSPSRARTRPPLSTLCREIEASFERYIETRDTFWFAVQGQDSCAAVVAQCWRAAGGRSEGREDPKGNRKARKTGKTHRDLIAHSNEARRAGTSPTRFP
jgi:hypothetical protein